MYLSVKVRVQIIINLSLLDYYNMDSQCGYSRIDKSTHVHWAVSALLSLIFYCSGNFLLKDSDLPVFTKKLFGCFGYLICMLVMLGVHFIILKLQNGNCPNMSPESVFHSKKGMTPGFSIGILGGVFLFFAEISYLEAWKRDPSGSSIVFFLLIGVIPICSIMSYIFYSEKFKAMQIVGIVICVLGITLVGVLEIGFFGNLERNLVAYLFGISSMLFFSLRNLSAKHVENKGLDVYTAGMLNCAGECLAGIFLLGYVLIYDKNIYILELGPIGLIIGAGTLVAFGQYFFNQAVMTGNIGVVISLFNLNGFGFILLDYVFYNYMPRAITGILFGLILIGVLIMLFGDKAIENYRKKNRESVIQVF